MKLSAYQLKKQTQQSQNLEASFGNGSTSNQTSMTLQSNPKQFGSLKQDSTSNSKSMQPISNILSSISNENKENSSLVGSQMQKPIKGILKTSTIQNSGGPQYNTLNSQHQAAISTNLNGIQSSQFYKNQLIQNSQSNTLPQDDDAKNILQRVDTLLSSSSLAFQNPSKFYNNSSILQQSSLSTYSQFSAIQQSSTSIGVMKQTVGSRSNNQDLKSYIQNLESKVLRKKEKDINEQRKNTRMAIKKKKYYKKKHSESDSSISSITEEHESDSSSSSDSSDDEYENKYSKNKQSKKRYQHKKEIEGKHFKEINSRSLSQNNYQSKKYEDNDKMKKSNRNKSQNQRMQDEKQKHRDNKPTKGKIQYRKQDDENDQVSVSSYKSNVTHNGLNLNKNANFATELVFCIVCEDYIHVDKVDEHSRYCQENQQILSQSKRLVQDLNKNAAFTNENSYNKNFSTQNPAENRYQIEKINQKLMKIKIYLEEMNINPNIVNSSKIKQYSTFITQCCINVVQNNTNGNELAQNLNDLYILNKKFTDLENLSNKAIILGILVLGDKLKEFTKKKLDIIDKQQQGNNKQQFSNEQLDSRSQLDGLSDFSSMKNFNQNNLTSTPSTRNQERRQNNNIFQKQIIENLPRKANSGGASLSSYQQFNSQSDVESYSVQSQNIQEQKNNLGQKLYQTPNQRQVMNPIPRANPNHFQQFPNQGLNEQQMNQKQNQDAGRRKHSKIFQNEKPNDTSFKIQQVTHINHEHIELPQSQPYRQLHNQHYPIQQNTQFNQNSQQNKQYLPPQPVNSSGTSEIERKNFFEIAAQMKRQHSQNKSIQLILIADLYEKFIQSKLQFNQVESFIQNAFSNAK